ncbi:MAG: polysaccharide deacetylase family protein, partial [Polyangiaceae bacterium]
LGAVSVDLDEIGCYRAIHGLPVRQDAAAHAVYDVALERIATFVRELDVPLTVFAIGRDLARARSAEAVRALAGREGVEVENHSFSHRYDLSLLPRADIAADVRAGADAIAAVVDRRPVGFRAPGYMVSDTLFDALVDEGVAFDASVFPSPAYQAAKLGTLAYLGLAGRRSASIVGEPLAMIRAPADPYRPGGPWYVPGARPLIELPVAVTRGPRLPLIGTSVALAGERGAGWLARACVGRPLVSFELHGIDFLDANDGLDDLAPHQPDLRVAVEDKRRRLASVVTTLRTHGYRFGTLATAAESFLSPRSDPRYPATPRSWR